MINRSVNIGTRGSWLALKHTVLAVEAIRRAYPSIDLVEQVISTLGDEVSNVPLAAIGLLERN